MNCADFDRGEGYCERPDWVRAALQSNLRISSNSDGANWRPAALVTRTRHPDLYSMRALATVRVGLVNCSSPVSSFREDEMIKPIAGTGSGGALRASSAKLSNTAFGLSIGTGSAAGSDDLGSGATTSTGIAGGTVARFDD